MNRRVALQGCVLAPLSAMAAVTGEYDVRSFGARGDGKKNDTQAVQAAIDECSRTGGRLVFPPGEYRTGMIRLKSRVTIDLQNQAVWRAIPDPALYPTVVKGLPPAFLFAENEHDLHITGHGKIHGSGDSHEAFIPWKEQTRGVRPFGLLFRQCRNLSLTGVTLESSAYWMLRPDQCDDVVIRGIKIVNLVNFNNDGIDIVDCHRVIISDCILDCEDDGICLKTESTKGVVDVAVSNCIVSSHARALKISLPAIPGSRFDRIVVSNCIVKPSRATTTLHPQQLTGGLSGIDLVTSSRGASLTNVSFNNIVIDGVLTPIFMRLCNQKPPASKQAEAPPGVLENISISNVRAVNAGPVACMIAGHPGCFVRNVKLSNIDLAYRASGTKADMLTEAPERPEVTPNPEAYGVNFPAYGFFLRHVKDISIDGLHLQPKNDEPRPEVAAEDVHGLELNRVTTSRAEPRWKISNSTDIRVDGKRIAVD